MKLDPVMHIGLHLVFFGKTGVTTGNLLRGVPKVDECGLAEIGNSKEETCGTQFRQVRAARCVIPYVLYVA
jgi:hypothetical protein